MHFGASDRSFNGHHPSLHWKRGKRMQLHGVFVFAFSFFLPKKSCKDFAHWNVNQTKSTKGISTEHENLHLFCGLYLQPWVKFTASLDNQTSEFPEWKDDYNVERVDQISYFKSCESKRSRCSEAYIVEAVGHEQWQVGLDDFSRRRGNVRLVEPGARRLHWNAESNDQQHGNLCNTVINKEHNVYPWPKLNPGRGIYENINGGRLSCFMQMIYAHHIGFSANLNFQKPNPVLIHNTRRTLHNSRPG